MKRENSNSMSHARLLAIAAAAVAISACGGGGGGNGFPAFPVAAVPDQPAVVDSSAPCFNEADFHEGTALEFEAVKLGSGATTDPFLRKSVTGGREAFAGANPIAINVGSDTSQLLGIQQTTVKKEYKDLVNGNILLYGKATTYKSKMAPPPPNSPFALFPLEQLTYVSQAYTPPFSFPVDMKSGQVVSQKSSITKIRTLDGRSDPAVSLPATGELTYHGRENIETPLGKFNTCKFSLKIAVGASVLSKEATQEMWLAADGPYRGQLLKGINPKSPMLVTKMTYTPK